MRLIRKYIENEFYNVRANKDRRKKVDRYIISYVDDNNVEYRKSFEFEVGSQRKSSFPDVPVTTFQ